MDNSSFSELIAFRNQLDSLSISMAKDQATLKIKSILYSIETQGETWSCSRLHAEILRARHQSITENFQEFEKELDTLKKDIDSIIAENEKSWFEEGLKSYQRNLLNPTYNILERRLSVTDEELEIFHSRLGMYTNWEDPGMIIAPGRETLINQLIGNDPLYLVDLRSDLLEPALNGFNPIYQNRLCVYIIKENIETEILSLLPNNQFGVVLVYNFFNYRPLEVIKKYLTEIYKKLQPGGVVVITYNNCDHWQAVNLVEKGVRAYTPGHMVRDIIQQIGYEFLHTVDINPANTWVELKKPGKSTSIRGGRLAGLPIAKPEAIELHRLGSLAREFGMATPEVIEQCTKEELVELIIKSGKENLL